MFGFFKRKNNKNSDATKSIIVYRYNQLVKSKNDIVLCESVGDRVIVPIIGAARSLPTFLVEAAINGMRRSGKFKEHFLQDKKLEWMHMLWGDTPRTYDVVCDIYNYVVFSKKIEGGSYSDYMKWRFTNFFR